MLIVTFVLIHFVLSKGFKKFDAWVFILCGSFGGFLFSQIFTEVFQSMLHNLALTPFELMPACSIFLIGLFSGMFDTDRVVEKFHEGQALLITLNLFYVLSLADGTLQKVILLIASLLTFFLIKEILRSQQLEQTSRYRIFILLCIALATVHLYQISYLDDLYSTKIQFLWGHDLEFFVTTFTVFYCLFYAAIYLGCLLSLALTYLPGEGKNTRRILRQKVSQHVLEQNIPPTQVLTALVIHIVPLFVLIALKSAKPQWIIFYLTLISPRLIQWIMFRKAKIG